MAEPNDAGYSLSRDLELVALSCRTDLGANVVIFCQIRVELYILIKALSFQGNHGLGRGEDIPYLNPLSVSLTLSIHQPKCISQRTYLP